MKQLVDRMHTRRIEIDNDVARIELTRGYWAIVDTEDVERIKRHSWCYHHMGYAQARVNGKDTLMHRFILGVDSRAVAVDHINGNKLDNRKVNLRIGNQTVNGRNTAKKESKSGYRGLQFHPHCSRPWQLYPGIGNKQISLGHYANTALPALLFDCIQCLIADRLGVKVSFRSVNFPVILNQTQQNYTDWLGSTLTTEQLNRLHATVDALVSRSRCDSTYVYLAKRKDGAIKIGVSRNPDVRIAAIRYGHSCVGFCPETRLIQSFKFPTADQAYSIERDLHSRFNQHRIEGEWFSASVESEIVSALESLFSEASD